MSQIVTSMNGDQDLIYPPGTTWLPKEDYQKVLKTMPVVSVDLIINDEEGQVLLGKRRNRPAANTWFVPGGRLFKYETIQNAVKRISRQELGCELEYGKGLGAYHQIYPDNFADDTHGSHYITFAISIASTISSKLELHKDQQHEEFRWWPIYELIESDDVHKVTKNYFVPEPTNRAFL